MKYLLDTAAISELIKPGGDQQYLRWLESQPLPDLALSVLTIAEVYRGIIRAPDPRRKARLEQWLLDDILPEFVDRLLPVDYEVSLIWAELSEAGRRMGHTLPAVDSLIAATAQAHNLVVVTRNVRDFKRCGVPVLSPWATS